jgi:hypothetical protein
MLISRFAIKPALDKDCSVPTKPINDSVLVILTSLKSGIISDQKNISLNPPRLFSNFISGRALMFMRK